MHAMQRPLIVASALLCAAAAPPRAPNTHQRIVDYAPNVRIDWGNRRVEVDGEICLREGMLELLVCSPNTREHESIISSPARPLRIYEALGLIGVAPGHPLRYDEPGKRWLPPEGDPIRIDVRWTVDGQAQTADLGTWVRDIETGEPIPPGAWVFAGSYRTQRGALAADGDGTIVCVVDFSSALIALPELRSADNALLRLEAAKKKIPPTGTAVTLLLSAAQESQLEIRIDRDGKTYLDGKPAGPGTLDERVGAFCRDRSAAVVIIHADAGAPKAAVEQNERRIRKAAGADADVRPVEPPNRSKVDPTANGGDS